MARGGASAMGSVRNRVSLFNSRQSSTEKFYPLHLAKLEILVPWGLSHGNKIKVKQIVPAEIFYF